MPHIMLSYNWHSQELVKKVYTDLTKKGIKCWMDIHGGMKIDMMASMSEGIENSAAIIAFCTDVSITYPLFFRRTGVYLSVLYFRSVMLKLRKPRNSSKINK